MTPIQAIQARNPQALAAAFGSLEEASDFRTEILPLMTPSDCKWFWGQVMRPEQLEQMLESVRDVCLSVASNVGLTLNEDFTAAVDAYGDPILMASPEVQRVFYAAVSPERHSVLRFYLQKP